MIPKKKDYSICLIALGTNVIASTCALVIPSLEGFSSLLRLLLSILAWLLFLIAAIYLFIKASNANIIKDTSANESIISDKHIPERKKVIIPTYLAMIPILAEEQCIGVIEVAGFRWNSNQLKQLFDLLSRDLSNHFSSPTEKPNA